MVSTQSASGSWQLRTQTSSCAYCTTRKNMWYIYSLIICRAFITGTKDLRLSLATKRNHVRTVLRGMICAVYVHWLFAERSYIERYLRSPFTADPLSSWEMYEYIQFVQPKIFNFPQHQGTFFLGVMNLVPTTKYTPETSTSRRRWWWIYLFFLSVPRLFTTNNPKNDVFQVRVVLF